MNYKEIRKINSAARDDFANAWRSFKDINGKSLFDCVQDKPSLVACVSKLRSVSSALGSIDSQEAKNLKGSVDRVISNVVADIAYARKTPCNSSTSRKNGSLSVENIIRQINSISKYLFKLGNGRPLGYYSTI